MWLGSKTQRFIDGGECWGVHPFLLLSEDQGRLHLTRCHEITKMIEHVMKINKKVQFEYLLIICTLQSFVNSKKMVSFEMVNWMLNDPLEGVNAFKLKKLKKIHNELFENEKVFPSHFKINTFKFEYTINFVVDYLRCPFWFKFYILKLSKIIFSSKKLRFEKPSKKSFRINVMKLNFLKKKKVFRQSEKNRNILLFKLFLNEGRMFGLQKNNFESVCEAFFLKPRNCEY